MKVYIKIAAKCDEFGHYALIHDTILRCARYLFFQSLDSKAWAALKKQITGAAQNRIVN
jgi:hypothetical protein